MRTHYTDDIGSVGVRSMWPFAAQTPSKDLNVYVCDRITEDTSMPRLNRTTVEHLTATEADHLPVMLNND